ncbi:MAG TPA: TetR/AcrR family transcriptional regulator [Polyangiaceae bacterium]|nr:TetR/AcrR family transcriptional regulator [Polyangiaceae bacterium]
MKPKKPVDRRVQRTSQTLQIALVELIIRHGWDKISVQALCEQANVGRSTFYTHFADKDELLMRGFEDLRAGTRALYPPPSPENPKRLAFTRGLIDHANDQVRLFRALIGKRSGQIVQKRFLSLVIDLVGEDLAGLAPAGPALEATVRYVAGAFVEVLAWWVDSRGVSPVEADELFHRLTTPVLASAAALPERKPSLTTARTTR